MDVLHWNHPGTTKPTPHEIRVCVQPNGCKLLLLLEKPREPLTIEGDFPDVTATDFLDGWARQDHCWLEVDDVEDTLLKLFFAIRYVALPHNRGFVVWRTDHRVDVAYDILTHFRGSFEDMRAFYARRETKV